MTELYPYPLLPLTLGLVCFACFTWATIRHFVWQENGSRGAWMISLLSWVGLGVFVWQVFSRPLSAMWPLACLLFVLSLGLWAWTVSRTRATPPTLAFTDDDPRFLLDGGPYRWIRHPFYSAYLLFWIGTALATQGHLGWPVVAVLGSIYWMAARQEEGKFARSALAARYHAYAAKTGAFLPRLWLPPQPSASKRQ